MANLATDTTQRPTVPRGKTPLESGAVLRRKTPVLEFATSMGKPKTPSPSGEFLEADDLVDDVAPRVEKGPTTPLYPVIDRIVRRTRIEARETRAGTPWWLAGVVVAGLACIGAVAGASATGRIGAPAPPLASSVVGRTASVVAGRFTISPVVATAPLTADESAPIVKAAWTKPAADAPHATEHPVAATTRVHAASHGAAHKLMHPGKHTKKSRATAQHA